MKKGGMNIILVSFHFTSSQSLVNLSFISYMDELCEGSSPLHAVLARLLDVGRWTKVQNSLSCHAG